MQLGDLLGSLEQLIPQKALVLDWEWMIQLQPRRGAAVAPRMPRAMAVPGRRRGLML